MADWPYSTARWQRLRKAKLSESPLCETCERRGRKVEAQHVDHIVAIAAGGPAFPSMDGLRALCASCHSIKTNALDRSGGKGIAIKGCDVNGLPLDPDHPFWGKFPADGGYPPQGRGAEALGPAPEDRTQLVSGNPGGKIPLTRDDDFPRDWGV